MDYHSFKKILIVLTLFFLAFGVACYLIFADIRRKNEHISSLEHDIYLQNKSQENIISMKKEVQNAEQDFSRINNSIVPKDGDVKFIESLEKMARENNLKIVIDSLVLADNQMTSSSKITTLKITANIKGSWSGIYTFLAQMEALDTRIRVDRLTLSSSGEETSPDQKTATREKTWLGTFEIRVLKFK